jgi:hypothetical protein
MTGCDIQAAIRQLRVIKNSYNLDMSTRGRIAALQLHKIIVNDKSIEQI